ncbi:MAG: hypothetical protein H0U76_29620 [Ktedonobacteraceae bacterium]|nr:hypothetical protein [Ktedonobacteraceae bacterium]
MIAAHLPDEAYQLAAEYHLGAPIRVYGTNKREEIKSSAWVLLIVAPIFMIPVFIQNHFRFRAVDLLLYGICVFVIVLAALFILILILRAPNTTVYICTSGFIVLTPSSCEAVRWEEIARVEHKDTNLPCVVSLVDTNRPDIILSKHVSEFQKLVEELELKVQLARSSESAEQAVDLERQIERSKSEWAERQQAAELLYQDQKQYLATKDPDEAQTLGAEYHLGEPLGTYRSGFRSLPQKATLKHLAWVFLVVLLPVLDLQSGIQPIRYLIGMVLFILFFILPRILSRNVRLHIYTGGFIFINSSLDVIRWEQIEKAVYAPGLLPFFTNFCTFHLKNGEKVALSDVLEKQDAIKQMLDPMIAKKEVYPFKKEKDVYVDVGHLAD